MEDSKGSLIALRIRATAITLGSRKIMLENGKRTLHATTFFKLTQTGNMVEALLFHHTFLRQRQRPLTSL